jgi:hypothetical protein
MGGDSMFSNKRRGAALPMVIIIMVVLLVACAAVVAMIHVDITSGLRYERVRVLHDTAEQFALAVQKFFQDSSATNTVKVDIKGSINARPIVSGNQTFDDGGNNEVPLPPMTNSLGLPQLITLTWKIVSGDSKFIEVTTKYDSILFSGENSVTISEDISL